LTSRKNDGKDEDSHAAVMVMAIEDQPTMGIIEETPVLNDENEL